MAAVVKLGYTDSFICINYHFLFFAPVRASQGFKDVRLGLDFGFKVRGMLLERK